MQQHVGRGSREPSAVRCPAGHLCLDTPFLNTFKTLLLPRPSTVYVLKKSYQECLANSNVCMIAAASAFMSC